ncbi:Ribonuclease H-like superfamily [Sesbania bispinosa]|nr:Ribonuclease H-like superfamily [Sesbania bispinosa]
MANWAWRLSHPHAIATAFPAISSDHSPILLDVAPAAHSGKTFKYEAIWDEHRDCPAVVKEGWENIYSTRDPWGQFTDRADNCKKYLSQWHKTTFLNAIREIPKIKARLCSLQNADSNSVNWEEIRDIRGEISQLWKQEELFWGQRSRLKWIRWGGKNTRFFHATTIQRRGRKRLVRLKNSQGDWVEVKECLLKKRITREATCPTCHKEQETMERTFLLCDWVKPVWFGSQVHWVPDPTLISRFDQWLWERIQLFKRAPNNLSYLLSLLAYYLWHIWKQRNNMVFRNEPPQPLTVIHLATNQHFEFITSTRDSGNLRASSNRGQNTNLAPSGPRVGGCWKPPPQGLLKCNVDASWSSPSSQSSFVVLVRDANGSLLTGLAGKINASSPLVAEALGLRQAMNLAINMGWERVIFESDCLVLIDACRSGVSKAEIIPILRDILSMKAFFVHCGFTWVRRQGNEAAHQVAHAHRLRSLPLN